MKKELEVAKDILDRMNFYYKEKESMFNWKTNYQLLREFILNQLTSLDSEVEEAIEHKLNCLDGEISNIQGNLDSCESGLFNSIALENKLKSLRIEHEFINTIRQALNDKNKILQSKLNKIEEVVNDLDILKDTTSPFEDNMWIMLTKLEYDKIKRIQQILGDEDNESMSLYNSK